MLLAATVSVFSTGKIHIWTQSLPAKKNRERWRWQEGDIRSATCSDLYSHHIQTHEDTCAYTWFSANVTLFYTGPPDSSSIWRWAKAGAHQPHQQTSSIFVKSRHTAGRNLVPCQLLCGIFSSPYCSLGYFWGDNFVNHVALQVHALQTREADLPCECRKKCQLSNYWYKSLVSSALALPVWPFNVELRSPLLCLDQ